MDAILIREDGQLEGGSDPRGDDTSAGYWTAPEFFEYNWFIIV
jgi:hypothetical protein